MKYLSILLFVIIYVSSAKSTLIKHEDCSKGIEYWCEHVMNAKKCNAVDFCIQTVWENHLVQIDSNPLCDDCKEWVGQARDLISKNTTFNSLIKTLEWSCELCPNQNGKDKCKQLIEGNINEIQKILASHMDPDAVCSSIHLCNNKEFTKMFKNPEPEKKKVEMLPFTCSQCNHIGDLIEKKLDTTNGDDLLEGMLAFCGQMSSFSDSCSSLILTNFNEIHKQLPKIVNKEKLCHSTCTQHHKYNEGIIDIQPAFDDPDIPCALCEQLMVHLRELLISNTSEIEFRNMLEGICGQMPSVKNECINIVDQYADIIYESLVSGLDPDKTCTMIKICKPKSDERIIHAPNMPLVSSDLFPQPYQVNVDSVEVHIVSEDSFKLVKNGALCTACEYTMQLVHMEVTKNTIHDKILQKVRGECKKLPLYIAECEQIVDMFGDQIMEAVEAGTNPRLVCPIIKMCPPSNDFHFLEQTNVSEKPTCAFCLFAMQEIKAVVNKNSTKDSILSVLDGLCTHLSVKLQAPCKTFVETYSAEVVDMILADFTPQEACVFIRLCTSSEPKLKRFKLPGALSSSESSEEFTDFEDDSTEVKKTPEMVNNPQCQLCKTVIELIEQRVINHNSKDEIRRELENSCSHLRKFQKECKEFVDKYSDKIVDLVSQELEPQRVCQELMYCVMDNEPDMQDYDFGLDIFARSLQIPADDNDDDDLEKQTGSTGCIICEFIMTKAEEELNDKQTDEEIKRTIKNICSKMPQTISKECHQFIDYYFDMIIALIETTKPEEMCTALKICPKMNPLLEVKYLEIKNDIYTCAVCRGVVDALDTIIEDPQVDTNLENLEEKVCEKFARKFKDKCRNLASTYGVAILNLLKNVTESDQVCYKLNLCSQTETSGMVKMS
ncbi:prosaposin-like [Chironomus tepperi]|uniref:prosaposin-like n=1 Tax=Chironomus tepperi TaxID=113505 RepID=UPI00391F1A15